MIFRLMSKEQLLEGVLGATAFVIFLIYLRQYVEWR